MIKIKLLLLNKDYWVSLLFSVSANKHYGQFRTGSNNISYVTMTLYLVISCFSVFQNCDVKNCCNVLVEGENGVKLQNAMTRIQVDTIIHLCLMAMAI